MDQAHDINRRVAIPPVIRCRISELAARIAAAHVELEIADRERAAWMAELRQQYGMVEIDEVMGIMWTVKPPASQEK